MDDYEEIVTEQWVFASRKGLEMLEERTIKQYEEKGLTLLNIDKISKPKPIPKPKEKYELEPHKKYDFKEKDNKFLFKFQENKKLYKRSFTYGKRFTRDQALELAEMQKNKFINGDYTKISSDEKRDVLNN